MILQLKQKTYLVIATTVLLLLLAFVLNSWAQKKSSLQKIEVSLAEKINKAKPQKQFTVILKLKPITHKRKTTIKELQIKTAQKQKGVFKVLAQGKRAEVVKYYRRFWLTNAILVKATAAEVKKLASLPEVTSIFPNFKVYLIKPLAKYPGPTVSSTSSYEWNIEKINANAVWSDFSVDGTETTVAILDTGIDPNHPDLSGKVTNFVEVDEEGNVTPTEPKDTDIHGTHVAGIVAGGNSSGKYIGVAPGTKLIGAIVLPYGFGTFAQVMGGMQWAADPDSNPTTNDQPDVVNMSLGGPPLIAQFYEPVDNLKAAGVFPAIAIGNDGPGTTSSPGDVPSAFAVGATDKDDVIAWFSGGNEVTWYDPPHEGSYLKPDASAPGVNIKSSVPGGLYLTLSGTSMATPHVAGAAALLRSLKPDLSVEQISRLLQLTAVDLGDEGKDVRYGAGRIDAYKAAQLASSFGTIMGTIKANNESTGATVKLFTGSSLVASVLTSKNGSFTLEAAPGSYILKASKFGYDTSSTASFTLNLGETKNFSFNLPLVRRYQLSGRLINASTGNSVDGTVSLIKPVKLSAKTTAGVYRFTLPAETYRLQTTAYGFKPKEATVTINNTDTTFNISLNQVSPTLLVLDWEADRYKSYYQEALNSLGLSYESLQLDPASLETAFVNSNFLRQYKKVVWATGDGPLSEAFPGREGAEEQPALASYLDQGGNLFLTGQDIGFYDDFFGFNFLPNYLHARYLKDKANNLTVSGRAKAVYANQTYDLLSYGSGEDGANNQYWPDVISPDEQAVAELDYTKETTGAAALRTYSGNQNKGKVVYLAFGLEGIDKATDRKAALEKGVKWLDAASGSLSIFSPITQVKGLNPVLVTGQLTPKLSQEKIVLEQLLSSQTEPGDEPPDDWEAFNSETPPSPGSDNQSEWVPVAEATTTNGYWQTVVVPSKKSLYRAVWLGNANFNQTISATLTVNVAPDILVDPPAKPVLVGRKTFLSGSVQPVADGEFKLLRRPQSSKKWYLVKYVSPDALGEFKIAIKPKQHSYYKLVSLASPEFAAARSNTVLVKTRHRLSLKAETKLAPKELPIYFTGWVFPKHPGREVEFQLFANGRWQTVAKIKLENHHWWQLLYTPNKAGTYKFRALLKKDSQHLQGKSKVIRVRFY